MKEAEELFGRYSKPHLEAITFLSWHYGYTGNLDEELAMNHALLDHYTTDSNAYRLEIADCMNTIAINMGMRGDGEQEMRHLKSGLALIDKVEITDDPRVLGLRANLLNSLSLCEVTTGLWDNARLSAQECIRLLMRTNPNTTQLSIAEQVIARSWWLSTGNLDSCLWYIDRSIARLEAETSGMQPGKGSAQWLSYTSFKGDFLLQAGRASEAIDATAEAVQTVHDGMFRVPLLRESAMKLLLTRARALHMTGRKAEARQVILTARSKLDVTTGRRDLLALKWAHCKLELLEQEGRREEMAVLIDSMVSAHGLMVADLEQRPSSTLNSASVEALTVYGEMRLRQNDVKGAMELLRSAKTLHLANQKSFLPSSTQEANRVSDSDPVALLLEALFRDQQNGQSKDRAEAAARILADTKALILGHARRQEATLSERLPAEKERTRVGIRAKVFSANSAYLNTPNAANAAKLIDAQNAYDAHLIDLRKKHPDAFIETTPEAPCDLRTIAVREGAWVIDYYVFGDVVFVIAADSTSIRFERRTLPQDAGERLGQANAELGSPFSGSLRAALLDGIVTPDGRPIIVIPHKGLFMLNFEALPGQLDASRYLVEERMIRYAMGSAELCRTDATDPGALRAGVFSATRFTHLEQDAPDLAEIRTRGGLFDLEGAANEAQSVARLLNGDLLEHASSSDFLAKAGEYNVLHIGTHGFAHHDGTGNCYLLFEGKNGHADRVTRAQVAGMRMRPELVVLSACNTGVGRVAGGEGVASLSRAFFQAGSRSVISALWPVPDARTSGIMTSFYQHMSLGQSRAEALRNAKLDYLKAETNPDFRAPRYWAGLVLYGADGPLPPSASASWSWLYIASAVAAMLIILYLWFRRSSARAS